MAIRSISADFTDDTDSFLSSFWQASADDADDTDDGSADFADDADSFLSAQVSADFTDDTDSFLRDQLAVRPQMTQMTGPQITQMTPIAFLIFLVSAPFHARLPMRPQGATRGCQRGPSADDADNRSADFADDTDF